MAIAAVGTVAAGAMSANAAGDAADAANRGQASSIAEQRAAREQYQQNIQPYLQFGQGQVGALNMLNRGDYSGFMQSPDYVAALEMGTQQLDRGATSQGNLWGGGADADRIRLGQQLATQNLGNYRGALQFGASLGQNAAAGAGTMGLQSANAIGSAQANMGYNSGMAGMAQGNAWANTAQNLGSIYGQWQSKRNTGGG